MKLGNGIYRQQFIDTDYLHPKYPYLKAEVVWAVRFEYAQKPMDFLSRRIRLGQVRKLSSIKNSVLGFRTQRETPPQIEMQHPKNL